MDLTASRSPLPADDGPHVIDRAAVQGLRAEHFAQSYVASNFDLTKTAQAVGLDYTSAKNMLARPDVMGRVRTLLQQQLEVTQFQAMRAKLELARVATSDPRKLFDDMGRLKHPDEWDDATAAAVSSIHVETRNEGRGEDRETYTVTKIKLWDKNAALNVWARHFKIVGEETEGINQLASALAERLRSARARELADVVDANIKEISNEDDEPLG